MNSLQYEDDEPTDDEKRQQLAGSGERAGWTDPAMDVYDNYDESRQASWPLP
jgi:hypothetical protein